MQSHLNIDKSTVIEGLERGEFFLLFQPRFDLFRQKITSAEALVRWQHPVYGLLNPDRFISTCEINGSIAELGLWILKTACEQMAIWHKNGINISVSVNLSPAQFNAGLNDHVAQTLRDNDLKPSSLELEITEGILLSSEAVDILETIMTLGVHVSIDDFGTGHSSLAYLRKFAAHTLKIDRSFLEDVPANLDACLLLRTLIRLGHCLGMTVVCEGVEDQEQLEFLQISHIDQIQGFLLSKPVSPSELEIILDPHYNNKILECA